MISIIDYGMGNLHSVRKGFERVGADVRIVTEAAEIDAAEKIVLPGVGAFRDAISTLREKGLDGAIVRAAEQGKWFLGICLGLQLLFDVSYEDGEYEGLGIIPGKVVRFDFAGRDDEQSLRIPHMGWNELHWQRDVPLFRGVPQGTHVYFVHSYHVVPSDAQVVASRTEHGGDFVSSVWRDNVMATQFHPEKSQKWGLAMLKNFAEL
ncbi:MAG: imidazole glycerol phosphate synthase subunit HisH [Sedimentisphaerales bacterium]|nr:imidazole glycerol phosphate synthase subunit HisH [Sedimentisphaerales bacterium]